METFLRSRLFNPININIRESEILEESDKPTKPIFSNKNYVASNKVASNIVASNKVASNIVASNIVASNIVASNKENITTNKKWTIAAFCKGLSEIYKNPYLKEKLEQLEETNSKLNIQIKLLEKESKQKCNELENQITELKEKYYNIEKRIFYFQTSSEESSFDLEGDSSEADSD